MRPELFFILARAPLLESLESKHTGMLRIPSSPKTADAVPARAHAASHKPDGDSEGHIVDLGTESKNWIDSLSENK
jgi:hypothetical protein